MKKIMIIAGGEWQVPIIKKAKEMGYFVINSNLYEDSQGFEYADIGEVSDVLDKEKNLRIAKKHMPDAVITDQSDIAVPTVAYVAGKLGLPNIGEAKAKLFTDKYLMREFCKGNGFLYPKYKLVKSLEEAMGFSQEIKYPVVLKPTSNQSSRGVKKVNNNLEMEEEYKNTLEFCSDGEVLIEKFIGGTELTVEGFKFSDKHISVAISEKSHLVHNEMIADELVYKPKSDLMDYDKLKEINNRMVDQMELPFGITHAEYKYYNGEFYLIEIAARGGGTKISSHIIPAVSGIDVNELLIKSAFGEKIKSDQVVLKKSDYAVLEFFKFQDGKVKEVNGLESLKINSKVLDFGLNFEIGDIIEKPEDDRSRHGYFILKANSLEELNKIRKWVQEEVRVVYE